MKPIKSVEKWGIIATNNFNQTIFIGKGDGWAYDTKIEAKNGAKCVLMNNSENTLRNVFKNIPNLKTIRAGKVTFNYYENCVLTHVHQYTKPSWGKVRND